MPQLAEARNAEDDWTGTTTKAERRKRQNRLNQRARRRRTANKYDSYPDVSRDPMPFTTWHHVSAFRLSKEPEIEIFPSMTQPLENSYYSSSQSRSTSPEEPDSLTTHDHGIARAAIEEQIAALQSYTLLHKPSKKPLTENSRQVLACFQYIQVRIVEAYRKNLWAISRDHLLTVIHFNVYRALLTNMEIMQIQPETVCAHEVPLVPNASVDAPRCLVPSALQLTVPHPAWIDVLPHCTIRDNLIQRLGTFNEDELCDDLVGEIFCHPGIMDSRLPPEIQEWLGNKQRLRKNEDALTGNRQGMIVWTDPWEIESWEITPKFLSKWGWVVAGCEAIIRASNKWRASRNEAPLMVEEVE
ncbi:MAG: hypothetical protein MMC23_005248 [Stictis urceolatum]|nr:hypothetical protein [Stictis urceolata]